MNENKDMDPITQTIQIYKYLGHTSTSNLLEIAHAIKSSKQIPPNLLDFWPTAMYKVCMALLHGGLFAKIGGNLKF